MYATEEKTAIWVIVGLNCLGSTVVTTYRHRETAEIDLRNLQQTNPQIAYRLIEVDFD